MIFMEWGSGYRGQDITSASTEDEDPDGWGIEAEAFNTVSSAVTGGMEVVTEGYENSSVYGEIEAIDLEVKEA